MYLGTLNHSSRVEPLHAKFKVLFDFVKGTDFDALPKGKVAVDGDDVYVMNVDAEGADKARQPLEMHRQYIDVHILLAGREEIGWKPIDEIEHYTQAYQAEGDCALSDDRPRYFVELAPGEFCIVYPEDAHAPAIGQGRIRKLIGKVKL